MIRVIQSGIPVARIELLDEVQMEASNSYSKLDYAEQPTLFFEFHGSEAAVAEQAEMVQAIAARLRRRRLPLERRSRRSAPSSGRRGTTPIMPALALRPGSKGWPTDVCVPISRLAECIVETRKDIEASGLMAPIVGHVGDGNFHTIFLVDPERPGGAASAPRRSTTGWSTARSRWAAPAPASTASASARSPSCEREHGEAVGVMRLIKQTLDPENRMNPGKIFRS